jgi:hypothetical protein
VIGTNPVFHVVAQRLCGRGHFLDFPIRSASADAVVAYETLCRQYFLASCYSRPQISLADELRHAG